MIKSRRQNSEKEGTGMITSLALLAMMIFATGASVEYTKTGQNGRCIAVWNIMENRLQKGWSQILSLPRHLSLNTDTLNKDNYLYPLIIEPIEEMKSLRFDAVALGPETIPANGEKVLSGVSGKALELEVEIDPMKAREVGLNILRSPDGREQTTISDDLRNLKKVEGAALIRDPNLYSTKGSYVHYSIPAGDGKGFYPLLYIISLFTLSSTRVASSFFCYLFY